MDEGMESDADKVCAIFPELPRKRVIEDLNTTLSVEDTVNRALMGKLGENQYCGDDSDDDDDDSEGELPDLSSVTKSANVRTSDKCVKNAKGLKSFQACTVNKSASHTDHADIIDLSWEIPEYGTDFCDVNENSPSKKGQYSEYKEKPSASCETTARTFTTVTKKVQDVHQAKSYVSLDSDEDNGQPKYGWRKDHYSSGSDTERDNVLPQKLSSAPETSAAMLHHKKKSKPVESSSCANGQLSEKDLKQLKRKHELEEKRKEKEIAKKMREEKKEETKRKKECLEYEKMKKRKLQEASKSAKPGECMKFMTAVMDPGVLKGSYGTSILENLQKQEVRYEIQEQAVPNIITLWREATEVIEKEPMKLETITKDIVEDEILHFLPVSEFVAKVDNFKLAKQGRCPPGADTLKTFVQKTQTTLENRNMTFIVHGIEKCFREQKTSGKRAFRNQVEGHGEQPSGKKNLTPVNISRLDVEEALLDVQLSIGSNFRFYENDADVGKCVLQYIKAVAESIFKRNRQQTDFSLFMDSTKSVKVSKEGVGLSQVWRQQIQEFKNVSADMANAIMAEYPSPCALWQAYQRCASPKEAELLLQNIVVRRGAGVMATNRRIGKEVSRRMYLIIDCSDPDTVIK